MILRGDDIGEIPGDAVVVERIDGIAAAVGIQVIVPAVGAYTLQQADCAGEWRHGIVALVLGVGVIGQQHFLGTLARQRLRGMRQGDLVSGSSCSMLTCMPISAKAFCMARLMRG